MTEPVDKVARAGVIARKVTSAVGLVLAIMLAVVLVPFWTVGFCIQGAWQAFQAGRASFQSIEKAMGK